MRTDFREVESRLREASGAPRYNPNWKYLKDRVLWIWIDSEWRRRYHHVKGMDFARMAGVCADYGLEYTENVMDGGLRNVYGSNHRFRNHYEELTVIFPRTDWLMPDVTTQWQKDTESKLVSFFGKPDERTHWRRKGWISLKWERLDKTIRQTGRTTDPNTDQSRVAAFGPALDWLDEQPKSSVSYSFARTRSYTPPVYELSPNDEWPGVLVRPGGYESVPTLWVRLYQGL